MPKPALLALTWIATNRTYDILLDGVLQGQLEEDDEEVWQQWLASQTGFSFQGRSGHLNVLKETRSRGEGYWYAYAYSKQNKAKRYLGKTSSLTLVRLEEVAASLAQRLASLPQASAGLQGSGPAQYAPSHAITPASLASSLLLSKLAPPLPPASLVIRERLLMQLDQVFAHKLTLLSASAGFGKTTLLNTWAARCPFPLAWLSLEELDNEPTRFWTYVLAALRTVEPTSTHTTLAMLQSPEAPALTTMLTALINELMSSQQPLVLILDDFHVIDHPTIIDTFQFLLDHLPPRLHLLLAGRVDPSLTLSRLRARGHIFELRADDLRFTHAESADFLAQVMPHPLTQEEVSILEQRTEGWIAGLQLASLAIRAHQGQTAFIRQLSGNQRYILDYLREEVLERQPAEVQQFLLHTSILARLTASLCRAVTATYSAQAVQELLENLEKTNLFLVPFDEERRWYRFHSLFRDMLQARLNATSPELVPQLHQRASHWFAGEGYTVEAVEYALAGADYTFAADLIEQVAAAMWSNGECEQVARWLQRLPDDVLLAHARLALTSALYYLNHTYHAPEEQWLGAVRMAENIASHIEGLLNSLGRATLPEAEAHLLRNRIELLRGWIISRSFSLQKDITQQHRLAARLQELARDDDAVWKWIPTQNFLGWDFLTSAHLPLLLELKQQAETEGHNYEAIRAICYMGQIYVDIGQLHQAEDLYHEGLEYLQQLGQTRAMFGYFHFDLGRLYWLSNQAERALSHLEIALQFARNWQHIDIEMHAYTVLVPILLESGLLTRAKEVLLQAEQIVLSSTSSNHQALLDILHIHIWLAEGQLAPVVEWIAQAINKLRLSDYAMHGQEFLTLLRAYLALQRNNEALNLLTSLLALIESREQVLAMVHLLALQVCALHNTGQETQARQSALRLLRLTVPEEDGFLRVYLDTGQPMLRVLQAILVSHSADVDPSIDAHARTILDTFGAVAAISQLQKSPVALDSLTAREREVLHLMANGATNHEIAEQLVIQFSTAKKHVSNILSKLGAGNRAQAIALAGEYNLL